MNNLMSKGCFALLTTAGLIYGLGACAPTVTVRNDDPDPVCDSSVDLQTDAANCGVCGNSCASNSTCVGGRCVFGDSGCGIEETDCGSYCSDTNWDNSNCGGCGIQCGFEESCNYGFCEWDYPCFQDEVMCGDFCTDLNWDPNNCGGCGIQCLGGTCDGGICYEPPPPPPPPPGGCQTPGCGACEVHALSTEVPVSFQGVTPIVDDLEPPCAAPGSPETTLVYIVPVTGTYVFDTFGAQHDTVLYIIDSNGCGALACNDDAPETLQSEVTVSLTANQQVLVVLDGFGGDNGPATVNVQLQ
jgi:hypothetical protein